MPKTFVPLRVIVHQADQLWSPKTLKKMLIVIISLQRLSPKLLSPKPRFHFLRLRWFPWDAPPRGGVAGALCSRNKQDRQSEPGSRAPTPAVSGALGAGGPRDYSRGLLDTRVGRLGKDQPGEKGIDYWRQAAPNSNARPAGPKPDKKCAHNDRGKNSQGLLPAMFPSHEAPRSADERG